MRSWFCAGVVASVALLSANGWAQVAPGSPPAKPAEAAPPAAAPPAAAPQPTTPTEQAHVDGFRSAKWGMTEAQVKAAIKSDFNIGEDKVKRSENLAEKTGVLTVTVPDLLEGAGHAQVSYIFGYASKKLIQVNVLWGTAVDPQVAAEKVVAAADQLRLLFLDSGYDPQTVAANAKMPDGSILVFQGQDGDKHATLLRIATGTATPAAKDGKAAKPVDVVALSLSYLLDPRSPDIYRVKKGAF